MAEPGAALQRTQSTNAYIAAAAMAPLPQAVALDPRYAARKTREVVYGTAQGKLVLSSKASWQACGPSHGGAAPGLPHSLPPWRSKWDHALHVHFAACCAEPLAWAPTPPAANCLHAA